jgi:hypothetical protein
MICWFENIGSCTTTNRVICYLVSSRSPTGNGIEIYIANFRRFVSFSVCKSDTIIAQSNWLTHGNRYIEPLERD